MDQEVQLLNDVDILRAIRNSYLQKMIQSQLHVEFYEYKKDHLSNGEGKQEVRTLLQSSERNLRDSQKMFEIVEKRLRKAEEKHMPGKN